MPSFRSLLALLTGFLLGASAGAAGAQAYPTKPVRIVVGYAKFQELGIDARGGSPEDLASVLSGEIAKWKKLVADVEDVTSEHAAGRLRTMAPSA